MKYIIIPVALVIALTTALLSGPSKKPTTAEKRFTVLQSASVIAKLPDGRTVRVTLPKGCVFTVIAELGSETLAMRD